MNKAKKDHHSVIVVVVAAARKRAAAAQNSRLRGRRREGRNNRRKGGANHSKRPPSFPTPLGLMRMMGRRSRQTRRQSRAMQQREGPPNVIVVSFFAFCFFPFRNRKREQEVSPSSRYRTLAHGRHGGSRQARAGHLPGVADRHERTGQERRHAAEDRERRDGQRLRRGAEGRRVGLGLI